MLQPCWKVAEVLLEQSWNLPATLVKPGTLLESHWDTAGTLLEPGEPLLERGETLLELRWNLVAGTFGWNILLGTNAGVHFVFLFALFLALLNVPGCEVGSLA